MAEVAHRPDDAIVRGSVLTALASFVLACAPLSDRVHNAATDAADTRRAGIDALTSAATIATERARTRAVMDSLYDAASVSCTPAACAAVTRGELLIGMGEAQVYAATRSLPAAWSARRSGTVATFVSASVASEPRDTRGAVAMVSFADGRAVAIAYRETARLKLVVRSGLEMAADRQEAAAWTRAGGNAEARGDEAAALEAYDKAGALLPSNADVNLRIARVLDALGRPAEALIRYRLFLQEVPVRGDPVPGDGAADAMRARHGRGTADGVNRGRQSGRPAAARGEPARRHPGHAGDSRGNHGRGGDQRAAVRFALW